MPFLLRAFAILLSSSAAVFAQAPTTYQIALPQRILLWPGGAPGAQGDTEADTPSLTIYPINGAQKLPTAVIVFPGGGYVHLAMDHEGAQVAAWLNSYGMTAFVLRYRLGPKYHHPVELGDAQRAIRYVRAHAADYKVDPHRIGVWGFSAGGHLASSTGTHFDSGKPDSNDPIERENSRPDFMILAYPVITFKEPFLHRGSRDALLGKNPDPALIQSLSSELAVTKDTPPAFLFHTSDDATVPVQNSVQFYLALRAANVPAEMHIFQHGRHGVGLARDNPDLSVWPDLLARWLKERGLR
ncbi:MAG: alpha/beta hydrolase [Acidobacteriaceae bacterium]|nr:alpha/beta hydrolase [Acidobacteriaceae bacterium]